MSEISIETHKTPVHLDTNGSTAAASTSQSISQCIEVALQNYFLQLGDTQPFNLYEFVLSEVEVPLLRTVLRRTRGNQTKAAILLGLSRGTLRKKLKMYDLDI